jgi:hypothetical protein
MTLAAAAAGLTTPLDGTTLPEIMSPCAHVVVFSFKICNLAKKAFQFWWLFKKCGRNLSGGSDDA